MASSISDVKIDRFAREMRARGVKPELEAYNEAMIEEAEHLIANGLLEPPYILNCVLHTPTQGGLRGTPRNNASRPRISRILSRRARRAAGRSRDV